MNDTTDVRFWDVRRDKSSRSTSYEVRWVVGRRQFSKTRATKALAESFLSDLRQAAKRGEAFDTSEGLPASMRRAKHARSWFAFVLAYVDMKWPRAAAMTRNSMTDALATVTAALVDDRPGQTGGMLVRQARSCPDAGYDPEQVASPLAARPYDLRHAAVSLWLNAGVAATEVANRAGHSVESVTSLRRKTSGYKPRSERVLRGRAEGVGFEPTRTRQRPNGFQDHRHRPLGEPSVWVTSLR